MRLKIRLKWYNLKAAVRLKYPFQTGSEESSNGSVAIDTFKFALEGLGQILPDAAPFSFLKVAIDGLLFILQTIEDTKQNEEDFNALAGHLAALSRILSDYKENEFPPVVDDAVRKLTNSITNSLNEIRKVMSRGRLRRLIQSSSNAQTLASQNATIDRLLTQFHAATAFVLLRQSNKILSHTITNSELAVLEKLPVAQGALYDSSERNFVASCLKGTRITLQNQIIQWINDPQAPHVFWLNGKAGTGKSTVAQTIAELCAERKWLAASFFFSRDHVIHHSAELFFPTLARQIGAFDPRFIAHLDTAMKTNPSLPLAKFRPQFLQLILEPLSELKKSFPDDLRAPMVIVVDALDECYGQAAASDIISLIISGGLDVAKPPILKVFITSRSEPHICSAFKKWEATIPVQNVSLHELDPEATRLDIENYLEKGLQDIRDSRPECYPDMSTSWPPSKDLQKLVDRSAGLFIYASTILKFVGEENRNPTRQFSIALESQGSQSLVHSDLDQLYWTVLSECSSIKNLLEVLGAILFLLMPFSAQDLDALFGFQYGDTKTILRNLQSVLVLPPQHDQPIKLFHPSFRDFLTVRARSQDFYLDPQLGHANLARVSMQTIQRALTTWSVDITTSIDWFQLPAVPYACRYWTTHLEKCDGNDNALLQEVTDFLESSIHGWLHALTVSGSSSDILDYIVHIDRWTKKFSSPPLDFIDFLGKEIDAYGLRAIYGYTHLTPNLSWDLSLLLHVMIDIRFKDNAPALPCLHLGNIKRIYFQWHTDDTEQLEDSIRWFRKASDTIQGEDDKIIYSTWLAIALRVRSRAKGQAKDHEASLSSIEESLSLLDSTISLLPNDHPDKPACFNSHALSMQRRWEISGDPHDLDKAIKLYKQAVALTTLDHSAHAVYLNNLGKLYWRRAQSSRKDQDIDVALLAFKRACDCLFASPTILLSASSYYAMCMKLLNPSPPLEPFLHLLNRLHNMTWTWAAIPLETIPKLMSQAISLVNDAAALAIRNGNLWTALECVEHACHTYWISGLQIRQFLFPREPAATRLEAISRVLERDSVEEPPVLLTGDEPIIKSLKATQALYQEFYRLVDETKIQRQTTQAHLQMLLHPTSVLACSKITLVILNSSCFRCDAIVLRPNGTMTVIPLPLTFERLEELVLEVSNVWHRTPEFFPESHVSAVENLRSVWFSIVHPIVSALKLKPSEDPPRLLWCLTGLFRDLPILASGNFDGTNPEFLTDYATSSLIPTLNTVLQASKGRPTNLKRPRRVLFIESTMQQIDRRTDLELTAMREILQEQILSTTDTRLDAQQVLDQMHEYSGIHIVATVDQKEDQPADCSFYMPGEKPLLLSNLQGSEVPAFAYVSSYPPSYRFSLNGYRLAFDLFNTTGFTSIIAPQSPPNHAGAAIMSRQFYRELLRLGELDFRHAAVALRLAMVSLRSIEDVPLGVWARYIHVGI